MPVTEKVLDTGDGMKVVVVHKERKIYRHSSVLGCGKLVAQSGADYHYTFVWDFQMPLLR